MYSPIDIDGSFFLSLWNNVWNKGESNERKLSCRVAQQRYRQPFGVFAAQINHKESAVIKQSESISKQNGITTVDRHRDDIIVFSTDLNARGRDKDLIISLLKKTYASLSNRENAVKRFARIPIKRKPMRRTVGMCLTESFIAKNGKALREQSVCRAYRVSADTVLCFASTLCSELEQKAALIKDYSTDKKAITTISIAHTQDSSLTKSVNSGTPFAVIHAPEERDTGVSSFSRLEKLVSDLSWEKGVTYSYAVGRFILSGGETALCEDIMVLFNVTKQDASNIERQVKQDWIIWNDAVFFGFVHSDGHELRIEKNEHGNYSVSFAHTALVQSPTDDKSNNASSVFAKAYAYVLESPMPMTKGVILLQIIFGENCFRT